MKFYAWILQVSAALILMSACGVVIKTRYGNGLKINLGSGNDRNTKSGLFAVKILKPAKEALVPDTFNIQKSSDSMLFCKADTSLRFSENKDYSLYSKGIKTQNKTPLNFNTGPKIKSGILNKRHAAVVQKQSKWEPNILLGAYVYYTSIAMGVLSQLQILFPPFFVAIAFITLFIGLTLTTYGYFMLDAYEDLKGKWLAYSVFGTFFGAIALGLLGLMIYITLFI